MHCSLAHPAAQVGYVTSLTKKAPALSLIRPLTGTTL
jgi:hypothetical protein